MQTLNSMVFLVIYSDVWLKVIVMHSIDQTMSIHSLRN